MAQLVVRHLDDDVKERLRQRADRHGRSVEEEVRTILRNAVQDQPHAAPLGSRIAARFRRRGLTDELPELRGQAARPGEFDA
jgi:antitoxin FitA